MLGKFSKQKLGNIIAQLYGTFFLFHEMCVT
jgi:hypothetical protein